jgi:hypothetical protein
MEAERENNKLHRKVNNTSNNVITKVSPKYVHKIRALNAHNSNPMIKEATLWFAKAFEVQDFQASNKWMDSCKKTKLSS